MGVTASGRDADVRPFEGEMMIMPTETGPSAGETTVLERLNAEYIRSFMEADVAWYREHLADDFVCIEWNGDVLGKEEFLRAASRGPDVVDYTLEDVRVQIYGGVALIQATGRFTRRDGVSGRSRYTDIYARVGEGWRVVSAQITRARA